LGLAQEQSTQLQEFAEPVINIESSSGVNVAQTNVTSSLGTGITVNNSNAILIEYNRIINTPVVGILIAGTTNSNFVGNTVRTTAGNTITTGIRVQSNCWFGDLYGVSYYYYYYYYRHTGV
jgi:Periplasmic copper-binding protein (NosD)